MSYRIQLAKESFKFSASHFTLLSATKAERLHGHNYQVSVECEVKDLDALGMGFEFNTLKPIIKGLADQWDEYVLIPSKSPFVHVTNDAMKPHHLEITFSDRSYRFPKNEVALVPARNITAEELARVFAQELCQKWRAADKELASRIESLDVTIQETGGQRASFRILRPLD